MQKKLIALAIAGLASAPVFAQTNVTVYGVVDVTAESVAAKGGDAPEIDRRTRVTSNSSLIGFRGTEDLGNGLKALFQIESGFNADGTGTSTLATRDTFVGLTGGFGTLQLGKVSSIMRAAGAKVDFNPAATGIGFQAATYGTIAGVVTPTDVRLNNAVMYTTPSFSGLIGQVTYSAGEKRVSPDVNGGEGINAQSYQFAGAYENGPVYVSAGYALYKDLQVAGFGGNAAGVSDDMKNTRVAAKYSFPTNTTVSALYDRAKYEQSEAGFDTDIKRNAWMVGVEQKFAGNQAVYLQYARSQELKGDACDFDACDNTDFAQWTLGYTYSLSKRTMVKAYYTRLNNERNSDVDFYLSGVGSGGFVGAGQDPNGFGVGLRHSF
ncbi:Outer membrane porin protein 32 precursor [Azoarcus sp. Aa7]|nr:Outer membrane porin protein 32 precursor [Azoarcus sp. Aa7]